MVSTYQKKRFVLNKSEKELFHELKNHLGSDYYICPNMRIADVVIATKGSGHREKNNKIMPRHLDFVICDSLGFEPRFAIELNGKSHLSKRRVVIDEEKKRVLEEAGLRLFVVDVGENYEKRIHEFQSYLQSQLSN